MLEPLFATDATNVDAQVIHLAITIQLHLETAHAKRFHGSLDDRNRSNEVVRLPFGALSYRNYRLFYIGQSVSLIGTWLQDVGLGWLVYRLTGSALLLGTIQFALLIPSLILAPFAGVWVDRLDKKKLLITTQSLAMVQAGALAALVLLGVAQIWMLIALAVGLGVVSAFDAPGRQTMVAEIIEDRKVLPNAIALNSALFNMARLIGPAIAGIIIHQVGEGVCFALNSVSYIGVIIGLSMMKLPVKQERVVRNNLWAELAEGWNFVWNSVPIRSIIAFLATASFMGGCYLVLLPIFASEVFHGNANTLGYLYSALGLGALVSGAWLATRGTLRGLSKIIWIMATIFGAGLMLFAASPWLTLSLVILIFVGFGAMGQMTSSNTLVQSLVDDRMRGRVMAFYTMAFFGASPFGSLASGAAAHFMGVQSATAMTGALMLIAGVFYLRAQPRIRAAAIDILSVKGKIVPEAMPGDGANREAASPELEEQIIASADKK